MHCECPYDHLLIKNKTLFNEPSNKISLISTIYECKVVSIHLLFFLGLCFFVASSSSSSSTSSAFSTSSASSTALTKKQT